MKGKKSLRILVIWFMGLVSVNSPWTSTIQASQQLSEMEKVSHDTFSQERDELYIKTYNRVCKRMIDDRKTERVKMLKTFADCQLDENGWRSDASSLLIKAISLEETEIVSFILKYPGIDLISENGCGKMALSEAKKTRQQSIIDLLNQQKDFQLKEVPRTKFSELYDLIVNGDNGNLDEIKKKLRDSKLNINYQDEAGETLLMHAVRANRIDIIRSIFVQGDVDLAVKNKENETALSIAEGIGNESIITTIQLKMFGQLHDLIKNMNKDKIDEFERKLQDFASIINIRTNMRKLY